MISMRGSNDSLDSTNLLFNEIIAELKADGIEARLVLDDSDGYSLSIEAWYPARPDHVAKVHCGSKGLSPENVDCMATAVKEQLRASNREHSRHYTWDHTGTLWPD
jgi:hypothetical protein